MAVHPKKPIENIEWQVASISDVTVYISSDGTDTDTAKYMDMGGPAISLQLRTSQVITIEEINGFALKDPITVNANTAFTLSRKARLRVESLKLNILTATTNVKILAIATGRRGN